MPTISETIYAPELEGGAWIQGGPLQLKELRKKSVVLIDFWDYTCVNCIRTLPYVVGWHSRYRNDGLTVIGVHAPEFSFAREGSHVKDAAARFGLEYPIVSDSDYAIWRAYSNKYWPAKYLIDSRGRIRYYHFGEGSYAEGELQIQKALRDLNSSLPEFPPPMEVLRDSDQPGAVCYRVTPELYLGYARGNFGNPEGVNRDEPHEYRDPGRHMESTAYLARRWRVESECARAESVDAALRLRYTAREVNLVMAPGATGAVKVQVTLTDGEHPGADVKSVDGRAIVNVDRPRMYNLVDNDNVNQGALELKALDPGVAVFAFTFTSCTIAV
jgi:thiol-disulfide isomerase/thioredoxin